MTFSPNTLKIIYRNLTVDQQISCSALVHLLASECRGCLEFLIPNTLVWLAGTFKTDSILTFATEWLYFFVGCALYVAPVLCFQLCIFPFSSLSTLIQAYNFMHSFYLVQSDLFYYLVTICSKNFACLKNENYCADIFGELKLIIYVLRGGNEVITRRIIADWDC